MKKSHIKKLIAKYGTEFEIQRCREELFALGEVIRVIQETQQKPTLTDWKRLHSKIADVQISLRKLVIIFSLDADMIKALKRETENEIVDSIHR